MPSSSLLFARSLLVALLMGVVLNGCSPDPPIGSEAAAPAADDATDAGGSDEGDADPAEGSGPASTQSPESFEEYYRKLGVAEPVVDCYVAELEKLGVTSLDQLEADQALGVAAADRFDACIDATTAPVTTPITTPVTEP
jgi:hypothetical protein